MPYKPSMGDTLAEAALRQRRIDHPAIRQQRVRQEVRIVKSPKSVHYNFSVIDARVLKDDDDRSPSLFTLKLTRTRGSKNVLSLKPQTNGESKYEMGE